jgi:hypothetical protein
MKRRNGCVNSERQCDKVRINSANDDSGVRRRTPLMEMQEVSAIVRKQDTATGGREVEYFGIWHGGISLSSVSRRQHVIAQPAQLKHNLQRNVFVGIEPGH